MQNTVPFSWTFCCRSWPSRNRCRMLYRVVSRHPDPVHADKSWLERAKGTVLCPECSHIDRSGYPKPVDVYLRSLARGEVTSGSLPFAGVKVFRKDFIDHISQYLSEFIVGRCFWSDGTVIDDHVTCYSDSYLVVRGNTKSKYYVCSTCGIILSQLGRSPTYVLRRHLGNPLVYQNGFGGFLLDEEFALGIDWSPWPDVCLDAVGIRDTPIDGQILPGDPPEGYPEEGGNEAANPKGA